MADQQRHLSKVQGSRSINWILFSSSVLVALSVGLSIGFVVGNERCKASNQAEISNANMSATKAIELQKNAEKQLTDAELALRKQNERFAQHIELQKKSQAQYEARKIADAKQIDKFKTEMQEMIARAAGSVVEKKAKENDIKQQLANGEIDQNDLAIEFIDNPTKFKGKELTLRLRFGPRPSAGRRFEYNLKEFVGTFSEKQKDGTRLTQVGIYGTSQSGAKIDLIIMVSPTMELPAAQLDDPIVVTFKCGSSAEVGNIASRIVRPTK